MRLHKITILIRIFQVVNVKSLGMMNMHFWKRCTKFRGMDL